MQKKSADYVVMAEKSVPPVWLNHLRRASTWQTSYFLNLRAPWYKSGHDHVPVPPHASLHLCAFLCVCCIKYEDRTFDFCTKNKRSLMLLITQAWWGPTIRSSHSWTSSQSSLWILPHVCCSAFWLGGIFIFFCCIFLWLNSMIASLSSTHISLMTRVCFWGHLNWQNHLGNIPPLLTR